MSIHHFFALQLSFTSKMMRAPDGKVDGTSGDDTIDVTYFDGDNDNVSNGNDVIAGSGGSDTVDGKGGKDTYRAQDAGLVTSETLSVLVDDDGTGSIAKLNAAGTDTVTSVENYVAGENAGESDEITLTSVVKDRNDITDIDTVNASGTFTPSGGGAVINFGPSQPQSLADILADNTNEGTISITDGDESGSIGNISFENFETINFDIVAPDFIVEGTSDDDVIYTGYVGDPEGDLVDRGDALDGSDNDVIEAGAGDDTIVASQGSDVIDGGTGRDTYQTGHFSTYTFMGTDSNARIGNDVSSIGDIDGDGQDDFIIAAKLADGNDGAISRSGEVYVVSSADLASMDAADGTIDGNIDVDNIKDQENSYEFYGESPTDQFGFSVSGVGDINNDGLGDFVIGALSDDDGGTTAGASYLVSGADLAAMDAADGTIDGKIAASNIDSGSGSYKFQGEDDNNQAGYSVSSAGDVDGDGLDDLIIGGFEAQNSGGVTYAPTAYIVTAADLAAMDAADGANGIINLGNVAAQPGSYQFTGADLDSQVTISVSSAGDVDGDGFADLLIGMGRQDGGTGTDTGETYLVSGADLAAMDAADGADGTIDISNIAAQANSYIFEGAEDGDKAGYAVSSAGDVDGDGLDDLLIGAYTADGSTIVGGETYLVSGTDLADMDAADGTVDGVIDLDNVNDQTNSYEFQGEVLGDLVGFDVSAAGDVDGDGFADFLVGAINGDGGGGQSGESYLVSGADLAAMDLADGTSDGVILMSNVAGKGDSYKFIGRDAGDGAANVSSAGDVDGDGFADLLIGANTANGNGFPVGEAYLITSNDLAAMDAADGTIDGVIDLGNTQGDGSAIQVTVQDNGDGTVDKNGGLDQDTITSIEHFDGSSGTGDSITLTTTVTDRSTITDLDTTNVVGTFTETFGGGVINFGPGETLTLADILADATSNGTVSITDGDGTAQIGNICFGDFEEVEFKIVCFVKGTLIKTISGDRPIETLEAGDMVWTVDDGYQELKWIGNRTVLASGDMAPIMIKAGALDNHTDLLVSQQHRMLISGWWAEVMFDNDEVLATAKNLVNGDTIFKKPGGLVTYYHMMFDGHQIVKANGALSESFHPGDYSMASLDQGQRDEVFGVFPELRQNSASFGQAARQSLKPHEILVVKDLI